MKDSITRDSRRKMGDICGLKKKERRRERKDLKKTAAESVARLLNA